jgi:UDP-glucose 6-dehydrogenase
MFETFAEKGMIVGDNLFGYDKFKSGENICRFEDCLNTTLMFLALPTQYKHATREYDKTAIFETCKKLTDARYDGTIVIKSTVEP